MADENDDVGNHSLERPAFGALLALIVAPLIAQGLWRPLVHVFGPAGSSGVVTAAALVISAAVALIQALRPRGTPLLSLGLGFLIAASASAGWSLGWAGLLTLLVTASALAFLLRWLFPRLPAALDGLAKRHRVLTGIYVLVALLTVVSTARVSIFMGDSTRVDLQALPGEKFLETHSCLTAYVHADALSRQRVANLYETSWWSGAHGMSDRAAGVENPYQPFLLDYYAYPPPFLLVMSPLAPLAGDFAAQRALWFGLNGLLLAVGLWLMARWLDGPSSHRVLLLAPIFFGSLPVLATLQTGNFQVAVVMLAVLSMVAFHRDRHALGGALLAFAILSKISPGVLGIVLLAQRRFRSAAWTAGFAVLFLGLSVVTVGPQPLKAFLTYTLPRLGSGEAFSFMDDDAFSIVTNMSPFGLPFKLQLLGVNVGDPWLVGRWLGRVYSALLVVVALLSARRLGDRRAQALTWMSLLVLAALQSPFGPAYTLIGLLWAITLLTVEVQSLRGALGLVLLWLGLVVVPPVSMSVHVVQSLLQSSLAIGVSAFLILRTACRFESSAPTVAAVHATP
jgi:hypothetical protein